MTKLGELEQLWRKISGALKSAIDAHGPITELLITSTTKRIVGSINAPEEQAEIMHELAEIDELRHALAARDERIRELEQQRDDNIRRQNATLEECERNLYLQINDLEDKNESLEKHLKAASESYESLHVAYHGAACVLSTCRFCPEYFAKHSPSSGKEQG